MDERHGFGEMTWTDNSMYVGQWERGIQHGYGRITLPDGTTKEGYFENNIYRGAIMPKKLDDEQRPDTAVSALGNTTKIGKVLDLDKMAEKTINIII